MDERIMRGVRVIDERRARQPVEHPRYAIDVYDARDAGRGVDE